MKLVFILMVLSAFVFSCNNTKTEKDKEITSDLINNPASASNSGNKDKQPKIEFAKEEHDFGELVEGQQVMYSFKFTNTGKSNLVISDVKPDCGCTVPKFPKDPISTGESGFIELKFNSDGYGGKSFFKKVEVYSNTIPNTTKIYIKGFVKKKTE